MNNVTYDTMIAQSEAVFETLEPRCEVTLSDSSRFQNHSVMESLLQKLERLEYLVTKSLIDQQFDVDSIEIDRFLTIRYKSSTHNLNIRLNKENLRNTAEDVCNAFATNHQRSLGFVLDSSLMVEEIRVVGIGKAPLDISVPIAAELPQLPNTCEPMAIRDVWYDVESRSDSTKLFEAKLLKTKVFRANDLEASTCIKGAALICSDNTTVLIEPQWTAAILEDKSLLIWFDESVAESAVLKKTATKSVMLNESDSTCHIEDSTLGESLNPVTLSIMAHRFMSIAEQMGYVLQRTAASVNIKERLDFSCALFDSTGSLIANAPHVPVHLGSMQEAVKAQKLLHGDSWLPGEVILCNHPGLGGSHLPDLTVITPIWTEGFDGVSFYVASRGHHTDIGGPVPGSMPPASVFLMEEGAVIRSFKLVQDGQFAIDACAALFGHRLPKWSTEDAEQALLASSSIPACRNGNIPPVPGSRHLNDNINDLKAQVAANNQGAALMNRLIKDKGIQLVQRYMKYLQTASAEAVQEVLDDAYDKLCQPLPEGGGTTSHSDKIGDVADPWRCTHASDSMDDGSVIQLQLSINKIQRKAIFDFSGSGPQVHGNWNAPIAITKSAIIYCLRCLVDRDIPLNQGCMDPIEVLVPQASFLNPEPDAAVVAGNVLTSQRITDVILKAFGAGADSYGCTNNVTFGNSKFAFYETIGGGCGATSRWQGCSAIQCHMTNTRITDTEVIERRYPVLLTTFGIRKGSGGYGMFSGGDGIHREYLFLEDGIQVNLLTERRAIAPSGCNFGASGKRGLNLWFVRRPSKTDSQESSARSLTSPWMASCISDNPLTQSHYIMLNVGGKKSFTVRAGDRLVMLTPGGGGYGEVRQTL